MSLRDRPPRSTRRDGRPRPRGRGRPPVISNERLLDVAREVFLEKGIRATTADVAERAGISEGTIFHRFRSKDELFRSAMRFDPQNDLRNLFLTMEAKAGTGDLREILTELATRMLELGRIAIPIMMMSWSNPEGEYSLEKMVSRGEGYRVACGSIQGFFEREIERGRMANVDPQVLARVFMGSLHHYCMSQFFLVNQGPLAIPPEVYVQGLVDLVMRASAPHEAPPRTKLERL